MQYSFQGRKGGITMSDISGEELARRYAEAKRNALDGAEARRRAKEEHAAAWNRAVAEVNARNAVEQARFNKQFRIWLVPRIIFAIAFAGLGARFFITSIYPNIIDGSLDNSFKVLFICLATIGVTLGCVFGFGYGSGIAGAIGGVAFGIIAFVKGYLSNGDSRVFMSILVYIICFIIFIVVTGLCAAVAGAITGLFYKGLRKLLKAELNLEGKPTEETEEIKESPASDFKCTLHTSSLGNYVTVEYIGNAANVVVPAVIDGYPVVVVTVLDMPGGEIKVLEGKLPWHVESVTLFPGVLFAHLGGMGIKKVTLPDGIISVYLVGCYGMPTVNLPASVKEVTFVDCAIRSVTLPEGVTKVSFEGCDKLETVTLPDSITEIAEKAFKGCTSLTTLNINGNIGRIDSSAFHNCSLNIGPNVTKISNVDRILKKVVGLSLASQAALAKFK